MAPQRVILTYRDYEALPNDGRRYEIHDGEVSVTPAPSPRHQETSANLFRALDAYITSRRLGKILYSPIDVILSDTSIVQPNLVYLETRRLPAMSSRGIEGPPTLVVEILSPSTTAIDRTTKSQLYARYGVPSYWIVDPEARTIEAYTLEGGAYDLRARGVGTEPFSAPPFADLALNPASLWP